MKFSAPLAPGPPSHTRLHVAEPEGDPTSWCWLVTELPRLTSLVLEGVWQLDDIVIDRWCHNNLWTEGVTKGVTDRWSPGGLTCGEDSPPGGPGSIAARCLAPLAGRLKHLGLLVSGTRWVCLGG